ncbi:MAG: Hpt domain-containing protein [Lachnospiraceae bacterium]|nr:Hpt domain-containing protein [Lachnospiraceae bacterium]
MTVKECYDQMGADYKSVYERLGNNEQLVEHFFQRFAQDMSFAALKEAREKQDQEAAFRAVHTLKGICINLGLTNLYQVSSDLTEALRNGKPDPEVEEQLYQKVEQEYHRVIERIEMWKTSYDGA